MGSEKLMRDSRDSSRFKCDTTRLAVLGLVGLLLLLAVSIGNQHLLSSSSGSVIYTYMDSLTKGEIGTGYGAPTPGMVPFALLEPGDIILGGWPNTSYGRYSHAGLYLGGHEVLEGYVDYGLSIQDLNTYQDYSLVCLLRVDAPAETKARAVDYALGKQKEMFYPLAFKEGDRLWNCTKIIWRAYAEQGIDLDEIGDLWIAPESLAHSRWVSVIYEKG